MDNTITGFAHLDKIADEIGDEAGTCDADYAFQKAAALMIYNLRTALEAAEKALLKEEVYSEELESQLQHAREENERLRAERGWLAENAADRPCAYDSCPFGLHRPTGPDDDDCDKTHAQCWQEAARCAVAARGRT
ncbi:MULTISPECIES: hypothetical protein [Desulfovibrio]|uniref:Ead/Ea22-like family protein n=1 Tax=Desulfovibrio desulfuricans TaxID=876 RepID=A0AA94L1B7_DESDE|nr:MULTISPECIES: hypothetical protein [Desulfovibrio]ATD81114.1 hypothetical protein CNY67_06760 [Desulfovibrio sp. G11]SFW23610.1 hypothetical protein SAMN02910291_00506 [Desulfovibrio desulfuricans]SPD36727.1 Hypothetical protein DSVG11_2693 [Desulfovibrio sp. G11]